MGVPSGDPARPHRLVLAGYGDGARLGRPQVARALARQRFVEGALPPRDRALEVALDLPPAQVRESAALLRLTAHQALEELRDVIGVLREEPGQERASTVPQPTLADIPRLVEETRRSGTKIDFEMQVDGCCCRTWPSGS